MREYLARVLALGGLAQFGVLQSVLEFFVFLGKSAVPCDELLAFLRDLLGLGLRTFKCTDLGLETIQRPRKAGAGIGDGSRVLGYGKNIGYLAAKEFLTLC